MQFKSSRIFYIDICGHFRNLTLNDLKYFTSLIITFLLCLHFRITDKSCALDIFKIEN